MEQGMQMLFALFGGLAMFLYGMDRMSRALQRAAGDAMKRLLARLTATPLLGVLTGLAVTAVLQSSSAATVMVIGFVSAGLLELPRAVAVIYGINIGTTMTAQLIAFDVQTLVYPVLFLGFLMPFIGTTLFACLHTYPMLLASSFIIGLGMAMLQTVLNPLQRVVGGEENYAFVAEVAQFVFGIASFLSPLVYTYLIHELNPDIYTEGRNFFIDLLAGITPPDLPWVSLYWVFTLLLLVMLVAVGLSRFHPLNAGTNAG